MGQFKRILPFDCIIMDTEDQRVTNPYSGESVMLEPDAVAVYDVIKGAEITGNATVMSKGIRWFAKHFPNEYMILLD